MHVVDLEPVAEYRVGVDELSGLTWARGGLGAQLWAVGDESTALHGLRSTGGGPTEVDVWPTTYPKPRRGSNFEGVAADGCETVVILTEDPPGLVIVRVDTERPGQTLEHRRFDLDEDELRDLGDLGSSGARLEGVALLRDGHLLVAQEQKPTGLFELGPPGSEPLGWGRRSFLADGSCFAVPSAVVPLAWWPVAHGVEDVSDLISWNGRLYLLSDRSRRIARVATDDRHDEVRFDAAWDLPKRLKNPEGVAVDGNGHWWVGLDVALDDGGDAPNLVAFANLPEPD